MESKESIALLNTLIKTNNDRIKGYKAASNETDEGHLRTIFNQFEMTSQRCKTQLISEVEVLGGVHNQESISNNMIGRFWNYLRTSLSSSSRNSILKACEYEEVVTKKVQKSIVNKIY